MTVGIIFVLVSTAIYGWVFVIAATDHSFFLRLSFETKTYTGDYGSQDLSTVATLTGPSVTLFLIGWLLISIADIARRRPRPVSALTLLVLAAVSLVLWLAVVPLQFATGVLPGDPSFDGARTLAIAPAITFALGAIAPVGWLVVRVIRSRGSRSAE
jgi:hypothetical protein